MTYNNTLRPTETECIDMWEESNNAKEYEALYDKAMAHNNVETRV